MPPPIAPFGGGPGSGSFPPLLIANNLADIQNVALALQNLGLSGINTVGGATTITGGLTVSNLTASPVVSTSGGVLSVVTASGAAVAANFKATSFYPVMISGTVFYMPLCSGAW